MRESGTRGITHWRQQMDRESVQHMEYSVGIQSLFEKCNAVFVEYNQMDKGLSSQNMNADTLRKELSTMRHALLLRRCIEYSIGKRSTDNAAQKGKTTKTQVMWRKKSRPRYTGRRGGHSHYQQQQQQHQKTEPWNEFDVPLKDLPNTNMKHIRDHIARKLNVKPARKVLIYRRFGNRFIVIEDHVLQYLSYSDLSSQKKVELEVSVENAEYQSSSWTRHFNDKFKNFETLQNLLRSKFTTTQLSAYYVLRYMIPPSGWIRELGHRPHDFFRNNTPLMNIFNIDVIRYWLDLDCISSQERDRKEKVTKIMYNKDVFAVLFDLLVDDPNGGRNGMNGMNGTVGNHMTPYTSPVGHNGISRLFWILQFQRLCYMFWQIEVDKAIFNQSDPRDKSKTFRLISGYTDRSDQIMTAMVNAIDVMLNTDIPNQQLTQFDMTSPKMYEQVLSTTIRKCFTLASRLIINKDVFLNDKRRMAETNHEPMVQENILEEIFLEGLEKLQNVLGKVLFGGSHSVRTAIHDGIKRFFDDNSKRSEEQLASHLRRVLGILVGLIPENVTSSTRHCSRFFGLVQELILKLPKVTEKFVDPVLQYIFAKLEVMQKPNKKTDTDNLKSLLQCADRLYQRFQSTLSTTKHNSVAVKHRMKLLMRRCLFGEVQKGKVIKAKAPELLCSAGTREKEYAFNLLLKMIECHGSNGGSNPLLKDLFEDLAEHLNVAPSKCDVADDSEDEDEDNKHRKGSRHNKGRLSNTANQRRDFVGLANLGCTCYLNSIVQQLFMVPSFTNEILSIDSPAIKEKTRGSKKKETVSGGTSGYDANLLHELQRIFLQLKISQKRFLNPTSFCKTVHTADGRQIDFYEQTDCQEILTALLSQLEQCLRASASGDRSGLLDDHFGCELQYITKCCNGHISRTPSIEKALGMTVQDTCNLQESFDKFVEGEVMKDNNAYFCSQCNDKVSATRRQTIWKPPKQLILNLKRFEWNFETMIRKKINTRFEFDAVINIKEYMTFNWTGESEEEKERETANGQNGSSSRSRSKSNGKKKTTKRSEDEYIYDLVGIVVHQGTADRGHYYAFIKNRGGDGGNQWYEFNDKNVIKRDYQYIQKEAFGGSDTVKLKDENSNQQRNNRSNNPWNTNRSTKKAKEESVELLSERNAYVLFYEQRAVKLEEDRLRRQRLSQSNRRNGDYKTEEKENEFDAEEPWRGIDYLEEQSDGINSENMKLFRQQTLYDQDFVKFMRAIYERILPFKMSREMTNRDQNVNKSLMRFVFNVVPAKVNASKDIKWWWNRLKQAMDADERDAKRMVSSNVLPSYLMNIFGKTKADNRRDAEDFFEHIIKKVAPMRSTRGSGMLLDTLMEKLIIVIDRWKPTRLTTPMGEIVSLIKCIEAQSMQDSSYLLNHSNSLLHKLKNLMIDDFEFCNELGQNTPDHIWNALPRSESNLDIKAICDLILSVVTRCSDGASSLYDDAFLRSLIARDYYVSQVHIVKLVVQQHTTDNDLECFNKICGMIHLRMSWLDFYEVWGALNIFNGLFDDPNDALITDKLNTGCFKTHLDKIVRNLEYYQLSKISILLLSELCRNNMMVRAWIQNECWSELQQIEKWCEENNNFNPNQRGGGRNRRQKQIARKIKFYRQEKYFEDKDKQQMSRWKKEMNQKITFKHLSSTAREESLVQAFEAINRRE